METGILDCLVHMSFPVAWMGQCPQCSSTRERAGSSPSTASSAKDSLLLSVHSRHLYAKSSSKINYSTLDKIKPAIEYTLKDIKQDVWCFSRVRPLPHKMQPAKTFKSLVAHGAQDKSLHISQVPEVQQRHITFYSLTKGMAERSIFDPLTRQFAKVYGT